MYRTRRTRSRWQPVLVLAGDFTGATTVTAVADIRTFLDRPLDRLGIEIAHPVADGAEQLPVTGEATVLRLLVFEVAADPSPIVLETHDLERKAPVTAQTGFGGVDHLAQRETRFAVAIRGNGQPFFPRVVAAVTEVARKIHQAPRQGPVEVASVKAGLRPLIGIQRLIPPENLVRTQTGGRFGAYLTIENLLVTNQAFGIARPVDRRRKMNRVPN